MIDKIQTVNGSAYVDFKEATDALFSRIGHESLAERLGVSVALIRQARLRPDAHSHRTPPDHWRDAVISMSEEQIVHFRRLIDALRTEAKRRRVS